jgi:hypothetical protein
MGARVYDAATREFLSPDPLPPVAGRAGSTSHYAYGFLDPVNHLDPSGRRPVSQAEIEQLREREERGLFGQAWKAITDDPWGTLALVGVVALGVAMVATGFGAAVGAGILINASIAAAQGVLTGNFSPRMVALSGALGAVPGGNTYRMAMASGAALNMGTEGVMQAARGDFDMSDLVVSGVVGGVTGGVVHGAQLRLARTPELDPRIRFVVDSRGEVTDLGPRFSSTNRPIVLGEAMQDRVIPAADRMGADYYDPPTFDTTAQALAHNRYWLNEQMNQGRGIIDIGPAPGRANYPEPTSPFYAMERSEIARRDYPWYLRMEP